MSLVNSYAPLFDGIFKFLLSHDRGFSLATLEKFKGLALLGTVSERCHYILFIFLK